MTTYLMSAGETLDFAESSKCDDYGTATHHFEFLWQRCERKNFWQLFKCNLHDQPIKFSYLMKSLVGDAREAIMRSQVTKACYEEAVE